MHLYHSFYLPHFHLAGTGPLLAHATIRRFAVSMIGIFSPVYVYQVFLQSNFESPVAVAAALGFWALMFLVKALAVYLGLKQASAKGLRSVLLIASIPLLLFFIALTLVRSQPLLLMLSGGLWGLAAGYFWVGFHAFFVRLGDGDHFGKEVGLEHVLDVSAGFIAPLLGGLLIQTVGFAWLFIMAIAVLLLSLVPLKDVDSRDKIRPFSLQKEGSLLKTHPRAVLAYAGSAGSTALNVSIWPVFVFVLFGSYLKLGVITALAVLIAGIVTMAVGFLTDRQSKVRWIRVGTLGQGFSWLARIVARSMVAVVGVDAIFRIFERVMYVPLDVLTYHKARQGGTGYAVFFREITQALVAVLVLLTGAVLILFNVSLMTLFAIGAVCSVGPLFLKPGATRRNEKSQSHP